MQTYQIISIIITSTYCLCIFSFIVGWANIKKHNNKIIKSPNTYISVVIALKNEAENIKNLTQSLKNQSLNSRHFEVIFINDHSTDNTFAETQKHTQNTDNMTVINLQKNKKGKKAALNFGIKKAKGKLIVSTDADCTHNPDWLSTILSFYLSEKPKMIVAPVIMNARNSFESMQSLDFFSLMLSGAAATGINQAIMCNGANLAFEKSAYYEFDNPHNDKYLSGDDVFLLLNLKKKYRKKIKFLKSKKAIVFTQAQKTFADFVSQRTRWASKSGGYNDFFIILISIIVLLINFNLLINFLLSFVINNSFTFFIFQFITKSIADFAFLFIGGSFFCNRSQLKYFFPVQISNMFLVTFFAFSGIFSSKK